MIGDVLGGFVAPAQRAPTKLERARIKRRQLARKAVARREESLLPLIDSATAFVVSGISDDIRASYKDPETRRREREEHAERMRLLHVRLPRLMEKISSRREQRILSAARLIAWDVFHYLKIQAKKRIGARILLSRRNAGSKREYLRAWHRGFRHRRLCTHAWPAGRLSGLASVLLDIPLLPEQLKMCLEAMLQVQVPCCCVCFCF